MHILPRRRQHSRRSPPQTPPLTINNKLLIVTRQQQRTAPTPTHRYSTATATATATATRSVPSPLQSPHRPTATASAVIGVSVVGKTTRSFSIDESLDELIKERDGLNTSAVVNQFLREFLADGRGNEAALEVRLNQIDDELAEARKEVEQLEREKERIEAALGERQDALNDVVDRVVDKVKSGEFPRGNLDPGNPAVQNWSSNAGVMPQRLVDEVETRIQD